MFAALLLPLLAAGPVSAGVSQDPPIELWIDNDRRFLPGDAVRVHVRSEEDGYLLVLHADPDGRVRVLFPIDPRDDNFVRGGKRYELRGRGDREAFEASITGRGMVYAAVSRDPLRFDQYVVDDHWDYRTLSPDRLPREPEAELTELVRGIAQASFDYDVLTYDVIERVYTSDYAYRPTYRHWSADALCDPFYYDYYCRPYYGSFLSVQLAFGRPYRRHHYAYDPYYYQPYYHRPYYSRPYYYDPFFYRPAYVYPRRHFVYDPVRPRGRGRGRFDDYRDRRYTFHQADDRRLTDRYRLPLRSTQATVATTPRRVVPTRVAPTRTEPTRTATRTATRRTVERAEPRVSRPNVERRSVEARRARPAETRVASEARPSQTEPRRAEPRRAEPQRAEPRRAEPQRAEPRRAEPERAEPRRSEPRRVEAEGSREGGQERSRSRDHDRADGGGGERRGGGESRPSHSEGRGGGRRR